MHWSEEIAQRIIERSPDKEEYVCAAGISPSGSIHIGNFRDVATPLFVVRALRKMGKRPGCCSPLTSLTAAAKFPRMSGRLWGTATTNISAAPMWTSPTPGVTVFHMIFLHPHEGGVGIGLGITAPVPANLQMVFILSFLCRYIYTPRLRFWRGFVVLSIFSLSGGEEAALSQAPVLVSKIRAPIHHALFSYP